MARCRTTRAFVVFAFCLLFASAAFAAGDFAVTVTTPAPVQQGNSTTMAVTITPLNGFEGVVNVSVTTPPGVTANPQTFNAPLIPGTTAPLPITVQVTLSTTASTPAGAAPILITATSPAASHTASTTLTVTPRPVENPPVIVALAPNAVTIPEPRTTIRVAGRNFAPGMVVFIDAPGVIVEQTTYISPTLADVTLRVTNAAQRGGYAIEARNPDGGRSNRTVLLGLRNRDEIGAPFGVTEVAIREPNPGQIIANGKAVYARGHIATSGMGTIAGRWRIRSAENANDPGVVFDTFNCADTNICTTHGSGMPVEVRTHVPLPAMPWGSYVLELFVDNPRIAEPAQLLVIFAPDSATDLTVYEPLPDAVIDTVTPRFRWTMMPGVTGYFVEFQHFTKEGGAPIVRFRTPESHWSPSLRDLQRLGTGAFRWRVRAIRPVDVEGEPTKWLAITIRDRALSAIKPVAEIASASPETTSLAKDAPTKNYVVSPGVVLSKQKDTASTAQFQLSSQGDLANATASSKFTGDLSYNGRLDPQRLAQESRNWLVQAGSPEGRSGGDARFGYTTPDFTDGAEFLTSGAARVGVIGRVRSSAGTFSYYQPVNTAVHGILSGNPENLEIRSAAFATPEGRPYLFRVIGLQVEEPSDALAGTAGSRMRTFGIFGRYDISPKASILLEVAQGNVRETGAIAGTTPESRNGAAVRAGVSGTSGTFNYSVAVRDVGANFVNPANRGLTPGGVSDRLTTDVNLGKTVGRTNVTLALRRGDQGRGSESTLPRAHQNGATLSIATMLGAVSVTVGGAWSADRGDADAISLLPATRRDQSGLNAAFSETYGRYALSQSLSYQRTADAINPLSTQSVSGATLSANGAVRPNINVSASLGGTRTKGSPVIGTTTNWTASLQPSIAMTRLSLSFQPMLSWNRTRTPLTNSDLKNESAQATLQWAPTWLGSFVGAQLSTSWNHSESAGVMTSDITSRTYQGSLTMHLTKNKGVPLFPRTALPGETPIAPPENATAAAPAVPGG